MVFNALHLLVPAKAVPLHFVSLPLLLETLEGMSWHEGGQRYLWYLGPPPELIFPPLGYRHRAREGRMYLS